MTRLTRKQLQAIHARKNEILRDKQIQDIHARKNQILRDFGHRRLLKNIERKKEKERKREILSLSRREREIRPGFERDEPFTVKDTKTISQADLIRMQREAGVRG